MTILVSNQELHRESERELRRLGAENLDLMELLAQQEYAICLMEMGVSKDDL